MPTPSRPQVAIAGPRRARPAPPSPPPPPAAASTAVGAPVARALPPLDYDEAPRSSKGGRAARLEVTRPGARKRGHRLPWFVLGIAFGALGAAFAGGGTTGTLHAARTWSAGLLRSLESPGRTPAGAAALASAPLASRPLAMATPALAPCPVDPGADDPCAALLAPFSVDVPTVRIEDLPRVATPPPRATVTLAHRPHTAAPSTLVASATAPAPAGPEQEGTTAPRGINPNADDPDDAPPRAAPPTMPQSPKPAADPPSTELPSARNEPS